MWALQDQANESLIHTQGSWRALTGLEAKSKPENVIVSPLKNQINMGHIHDILKESLEHEIQALNLYKDLLEAVENRSVYLEEYARTMTGPRRETHDGIKENVCGFF